MPSQTSRRGPAHPSHASQDLPGFRPTLLSLPSFGQGLQKIGAGYLVKHCTSTKKVWYDQFHSVEFLLLSKLETIQLVVSWQAQRFLVQAWVRFHHKPRLWRTGSHLGPKQRNSSTLASETYPALLQSWLFQCQNGSNQPWRTLDLRSFLLHVAASWQISPVGDHDLPPVPACPTYLHAGF